MAGIYIHFPFCMAKCAYCDFFSIPYRRDIADQYSRALLSEISLAAPWKETIDSIYFGGGTPSLAEPKQVETGLKKIKGCFAVADDCETTLEANPGTVTFSKLKDFRDAGVNRLSLGVQSLSDEDLRFLGRIHDQKQVYQAVDWLHALDFNNFGLDLIYGIPGQSMHSWLDTLEQSVRMNPAHISCYLLQLDEETPLGRRVEEGTVQLLTEDEEADLYYRTIKELTNSGFEHYELSNFARPGYRSRHNMNYWMAGEYRGFGAGAVSFQKPTRYKNLPDVEQYINDLLIGESHTIQLETMDAHESLADAMILGLRLIEGVDTRSLFERFGIDPLELYREVIFRSVGNGLLVADLPNLRLTKRALFLSNQVFREFLNS
ncbi:MAG: radical SAM family heme chaperone HemW [Ignavibacteriales bacterium]